MSRPGAGRRETTMADIAAHLGVSRQLVSLALRDLPGASSETRARVAEAAQRLGYSPHAGARLLRQSTSRQLGVVFAPERAAEQEIVQAIYTHASRHGYQVVLSATTDTRSSMHAVEELLGYRCAALVVIGADPGDDQLPALTRRASVPVVSVGAGGRNAAYDVVRSAGDRGIAECVRHLADLGHRAITYVHAPAMPPGPLRLAGYLRAIEELSMTPSVLEVAGEYTEECGARAARALLGAGELPTAVRMSNDHAALGLVLSLARAGVSVPREVSVSGFDDSRLAQLSALDLTTVRQNPEDMGRNAVEAALRRLSDPAKRPGEIVVDASLVVRGSTGPARR
jgi:DNA-binding LacI/PurR family transcriptional regulator